MGAAAVGPLLAACARAGAGPFDGKPEGLVRMANWPLYIDKAPDARGDPVIPSLERFTRETGIAVDYQAVIGDAEGFFTAIEPYLAGGGSAGWDVMVITNGLTLTKMIRLGYLMELPSDRRPNFEMNADPSVKDPAYDPGNRHSMAWQSGITGIAYDPARTGRDITSVGDLFSEEFHGHVGMFGDAADLPNTAMLAAGIAPETSTQTDWQTAAALLSRQRDAGIPRRYLGQSYVKALRDGNLWLSMAWSGDIYQANQSGTTNLRFVVPEDGALLWTDNMVIPAHAQHPVDALRLMDYVYQPDIAAMIAAYVAYLTPVPGARDRLLSMAVRATDPVRSEALKQLVASPLVFLDDAERARLHTYRELTSDEEMAAWHESFGSFYA